MHTRSVDADGAVTLVAAIVRGVPSLPGAACVGRWELFDEGAGARGPERRELERQRVERAAAVCRSGGDAAAEGSPPLRSRYRAGVR